MKNFLKKAILSMGSLWLLLCFISMVGVQQISAQEKAELSSAAPSTEQASTIIREVPSVSNESVIQVMKGLYADLDQSSPTTEIQETELSLRAAFYKGVLSRIGSKDLQTALIESYRVMIERSNDFSKGHLVDKIAILEETIQELN